MRKHLYSQHSAHWVDKCDKEGIVISPGDAEAQACAEERRKDRGDTSGPGASGIPRKTYTPDAFVDALVELIVGDDLVCACLIVWFHCM